jgi:hypothetical protein
MVRAWWVALLVLLAPALALAADPIRAQVDRTSIRLEENVRLTVSISVDARTRDQPDVQAPDLSAWELVGRFESTSQDGMRGTATTRLDLLLRPKRPGRLEIGAFTLKMGGRTWRTSTFAIEVHGGGPSSHAQAAPAPQAVVPDQAPSRDAFVAWEVPRVDVWLGEQIEAALYIYVNAELGASQITLADVNLDGFWSQQHPRRAGLSRGDVVEVGGRPFRRQELVRYTLFPIRSGSLKLPPARVDMMLSEQWMLGRGRSAPAQRTAAPIALEVKALPSQGRPAEFAGPAVGNVRLNATLDRSAVQADEAIQLTVTTEVDGLLQNTPRVALPELPGFKAFPPTEDETSGLRGERFGGTRRTTWLLRPLKAGRLAIPALRLPYFDPAAGAYRVAVTAPLQVTVRGEPKAGAAGEDVAAGAPAAGDEGPALRTIRRIEGLRSEGGPAYRSPLFLAAVALPPLLLIGLLANDRVRARRAGGAAARTAKRAAGDARRDLEALRAGGAEAFAGIARTLLHYLEARFGEPFNGLTHERLAARLRALGVDEQAARDLVTELENCDFARFAPAATRAGELEEAVRRATALVGRIEQAVTA